MHKISDLDTKFITGMVLSMYRFEASLTNDPYLLSDPAVMDFYLTFMGGLQFIVAKESPCPRSPRADSTRASDAKAAGRLKVSCCLMCCVHPLRRILAAEVADQWNASTLLVAAVRRMSRGRSDGAARVVPDARS